MDPNATAMTVRQGYRWLTSGVHLVSKPRTSPHPMKSTVPFVARVRPSSVADAFVSRRRFAPAPLLVALMLVLAGCSTPRLAIITEPTDALIQVNGMNVGKSPVTHTLDFSANPSLVVNASKTGYFSEQVVLSKKNVPENNQLKLFLAEDEAFKVTTTSEATNNWLRIQVDSKLAPDSVWQKLVDSVTSRYPSLEMIDVTSGYMRSVYAIRKFKGPKTDFQVRTRFICSISSKEPLVYKLKIEAETADARQEWSPYTRVFKEDAQLVEELQSRLGVK
jgi:hypothetical protein